MFVVIVVFVDILFVFPSLLRVAKCNVFVHMYMCMCTRVQITVILYVCRCNGDCRCRWNCLCSCKKPLQIERSVCTYVHVRISVNFNTADRTTCHTTHITHHMSSHMSHHAPPHTGSAGRFAAQLQVLSPRYVTRITLQFQLQVLSPKRGYQKNIAVAVTDFIPPELEL